MKRQYVYREGKLTGESIKLNMQKMKSEGYRVVKRKHNPSNSYNLYAYNR